MSFIRDVRSVEQQRFFNGQRLYDDDLQGIEAFNREMRWLHNQSLHQPGVGNGFAVTGKKGDRDVAIGPGYAIDDLGREIVLTRARTLSVPPVAGDGYGKPKRFLLTVAYPDDRELEEVEQRLGVCTDPGATRLRVEPDFCWIPLSRDGAPDESAAEIVSGRRLVLAEIAVRDCKLDRDVSIVQRRNAKPAARPYIAAGEQTPTAWRIWSPPAVGGVLTSFEGAQSGSVRFAFGIEAHIDTGIAGFVRRPVYFARLSGNRIFAVDAPQISAALTLDGLVHILDPTPSGFTARVMVLRIGEFRIITENRGETGGPEVVLPGARFDLDALLAGREDALAGFGWTIVWMGIEG